MRHRAVKQACARAIGTFENDPDFQIKFHKIAMLFWLVMGVVGVLCYVFVPATWLRVGVLLVYLISIYANWDTDYDAVSAASAFKHAKATDTKIEDAS